MDKALAVHVAQNGHRQHTWAQYYPRENLKYEHLRVICCVGIPVSYLTAENCNHKTTAGTLTPLAHVVYDQLLTENTIIPWDFILGTRLGALPAYWRQCTSYTRKHLETMLGISMKYRDLHVCAIGPVGIDLCGWPANEIKEYEEQRQNLIRFARLAENARLGLVIVIYYDYEPTHKYRVHADVINAFKEAGILSRQRIHLIFNKAQPTSS